MSDQDIPPDGCTSKAEAHARLSAAEFTRETINPWTLPRCELWKNKHGKIVTVDFIDSTFKYCTTDTLEIALQARDSVPSNPRAGLWDIIFGK